MTESLLLPPGEPKKPSGTPLHYRIKCEGNYFTWVMKSSEIYSLRFTNILNEIQVLDN